MRPRIPTPFALIAVLVAAGCGGATSPEEGVRSTVTRFADASAKKDYQVICDELLAPALVRNVEQLGLPCELALQKGLGDVREPKLEVQDVRAKGDAGTARVRTTARGQVPSTDTLELRRQDEEWRISALG